MFLFHAEMNPESIIRMKYQIQRTILGFLILLLLMLPGLPALAEGEIGIQVGNTAIATDGRAVVNVTLSNCSGMDSIQFDIWYDANAAMLSDAAPGDLLSGGTYAFNTDTAGKIRFAYASAEGLKEESGTAVVLTFATVQDSGTAVLISEAKASRYDGRSGNGQYKAFVTVENGGISATGSGSVPEPAVTPWIPETPTPSPEPSPEPTEIPELQVTPDVPEEKGNTRPSAIMGLAYLSGGLAVVSFAAAAVVLLTGRRKDD